MPSKVKETKAAPPVKKVETPKKAGKKGKKGKKVVEVETEVVETKVEETKVVEAPAPKKNSRKRGKKGAKKVEAKEAKEEMEVEDAKEKVEAEEAKENAEAEDTKEKAEGGEKAKRRRKRKRSEKPEDTEAKENESPKKKKKTNPNVPDEKLELTGELLGIYAKRKTSICERTLIVRMKKFKAEYFKTRPDIFKDAVSYGVKFGKMCFVIYESKAEAEKKLTELQKSPDVQIARQWDQRQIIATVNPYTLFVEHLPEGTTEEDLQKTFPTTTAMHYDAGKRFVNLAFSTKEDAETVFRKSEDLKMNGAGITVLFGKYGYNWERNPGKEQKSN
ncbi:uncharacterized protein LOC125035973 [Penaeus chinensis]|uniref:uncharacterized protein LOC125035973 n=1 Tax=Penaeus chinensis TaxID=139456 RepID=UPI001FB5774D|nr:uncharacterized protein LOC125035973 [Penaeus chinensis]